MKMEMSKEEMMKSMGTGQGIAVKRLYAKDTEGKEVEISAIVIEGEVENPTKAG